MVMLFPYVSHHGSIVVVLALFKEVHDDGAAAVGAGVLRQVVAARELLAAVGALEWLVMSVEGAVVALEMLLAAEAAVAQLADKGL